MERTYTILLDRGGGISSRHLRVRAATPAEPFARQFSDPPRPVIHRERLTPQELQELAAEPDFVAAAEIMSTRLLAPLPEEDVASRLVDAGTGRRRQSWGIAAVGADRSKFNATDVPVALLDSGIDAEHEAFRGLELVERDFTGLGNGDAGGHGTYCAGIFFGRNVGGIRIGVAPGVRRALIGKVLGPDGGDSDMLLRGIVWAHEQRARVISMSVGFDFAATLRSRLAAGWDGELAITVTLEAYRANLRLLDQLLLMLRLQEPFTGGSIVVAAAGNDSRRGFVGEHLVAACPPCGCDKVVSVGSLDPVDPASGYRVSDFSNCGVEISAPGRGIVSAAAGGGLKALSGTSAAAPHVAGVAALWWQAVKQSELPANATLVRGKLLEGAQRNGLSPAIYPSEYGAGRVYAPLDGRSLTAHKPAVRAEWPAVPLPETMPPAFEPISLDPAGSRLDWQGNRRPV